MQVVSAIAKADSRPIIIVAIRPVATEWRNDRLLFLSVMSTDDND